VLEVDIGVSRPQLAPKLVPRHELAGSFEQRGEKVKRLIGKREALAVSAQYAGANVHLDVAKTQHSRWRPEATCHQPKRPDGTVRIIGHGILGWTPPRSAQGHQ
jgi:hypothetical protein